MGKKGFTLIELVVALAILIFLATALVPTLLSVRKQASEAAALLFLKQVGQWVAALDTAQAAAFQGTVECTHPALQQVGAPSSLPRGIYACKVERDPAQNRYTIRVVALGGKTFEADYWLR